MNPDTRRAIGAKGISIWLKAEFDVLMKRIRRRHDRPLLKTDDPGATLRKLIEERDPVYALADLTVQSREVHARKDRRRDRGRACRPDGSRVRDAGRARRRRPRAMTAPLRASDPIIVNVALGERSYDIRHRPRPAGCAGPKNCGAAARAQRSRSSPTKPSCAPPSRGGRGRPCRRRYRCHFRDRAARARARRVFRCSRASAKR